MFTPARVPENRIPFPGIFPRFGELLFKPYRLALNNFEQKYPLLIERGRFIIKTIENAQELEQALELRYEVFFKEILDKKGIFHIDIDRFDLQCDHLIIVEKASQRIIGTYRLNVSDYADSFYSESEFDISAIKRLPGTILELGRACIHRDYRNGITIALLWRGIAEYIALSDADYLFGCSSVKYSGHTELSRIFKYLRDSYYAPEEYRVFPKGKFKSKEPFLYQSNFVSDNVEKTTKSDVPSLLMFYLKAGALICGEPAIDRAFKCADFMTLLNVSDINKTVKKKFSR